MLIRQHHFFDTYYSATGAKNKELEADVILNEVANIIVARPDLASANLIKAGISVKPDVTEAELAVLYQKNLHKKELAKLTAYEIGALNKTSFDGKDYSRKFLNSEGGEGGGTDWGSLVNSVAQVGIAIGGAVKRGKDAKAQKKADAAAAKNANKLQELVEKKQAMIENQIAKLTKTKQTSEKKAANKNLFIIVGVASSLLAIGAIIAYAVKKANATTV